jgi:hypothetical protein
MCCLYRAQRDEERMFLSWTSKSKSTVSQFGPQNWLLQFGDLDHKITVTVSWFGPQNHAGYGLSVVSQNRQEIVFSIRSWAPPLRGRDRLFSILLPQLSSCPISFSFFGFLLHLGSMRPSLQGSIFAAVEFVSCCPPLRCWFSRFTFSVPHPDSAVRTPVPLPAWFSHWAGESLTSDRAHRPHALVEKFFFMSKRSRIAG